MIISFNFILVLMYIIIWLETRMGELSSVCFVLLSFTLFLNYYVLKIVILPLRRVTRFPSRSRTTQETPTLRPAVSWGTSSSTTRNRNIQSSSFPTTSSMSPNSVSIAPAVVSTQKPQRKLTPALMASLLPAGQHLTRDDFRCIFCYEFPIESNRQVVICPHCRHPSHANEFQKWSAVANICSRCNKPVSTAKMIRLSGRNYERIIKMYRNKG
jgi:hypothetical protein